MTPVCFAKFEDAQNHYEKFENDPGRTAYPPKPAKLIGADGVQFDGWVVYIRSWNLD